MSLPTDTTHSKTATAQTFYLTALATSGTATDITFDGAVTAVPSYDAEAVLFMKVSQARSIFKIQTDAIDLDFVQDTTDVQYIVDFTPNMDPSNSLNPVHFMMDISNSGEGEPFTDYGVSHVSTNAERKHTYNSFTDSTSDIPDNRMLVKHDFARRIIKDNYGGLLALQADIFDHEDAWKTAMTLEGLRMYQGLFEALEEAQRSVQTDASAVNTNFSRVLLEQIIANDPGRLDASGGAVGDDPSNYQDGQLQNTEGVQPVPLIAGDVLAFQLTLDEDVSQNTIQDNPGSTQKIYLCKICLIGDDKTHANYVNTVPNDTLDFTRTSIGAESSSRPVLDALMNSTLTADGFTKSTASYYTRQHNGSIVTFNSFHDLSGNIPTIVRN